MDLKRKKGGSKTTVITGNHFIMTKSIHLKNIYALSY